MSAYFDAVNFARKIAPSVSAIMAVGFIDDTCPPCSVYAAYNILRGPKCIFNGPLTGHGFIPEFQKIQLLWMQGQLGLGEALPPKTDH
jgi:cephalosporin-C deacetylase-like acetyl esterase